MFAISEAVHLSDLLLVI